MSTLSNKQAKNIAKNKFKKALKENNGNETINVIAMISADGTITITDAYTGEVLIQNNPK
jgi:glycine betaine/choline ABC-type transport system substrate-binding protein